MLLALGRYGRHECRLGPPPGRFFLRGGTTRVRRPRIRSRSAWRREDDGGPARPSHTPLRDRRDRERELALPATLERLIRPEGRAAAQIEEIEKAALSISFLS